MLLLQHIYSGPPQPDLGQVLRAPDTPLASTEWGQLAEHVVQLSNIAKKMNPHRTPFKGLSDALLARFPYLHRSKLVAPWSPNDRKLMTTGVIICAGSTNFHLASHLIVNLRKVLESTVPIEIAFAGDDDLQPRHRAFMRDLTYDITFLDLLEIFPDAKVDLTGSGWAMKPFALLASRHMHAILIDADAILLTDPADIFTSNPGLRRTGTLLYHDRAVGGAHESLTFLKSQIKAAGRMPSPQFSEHSLYYSEKSCYEADSGLVAIDKSRIDVFASLVLVSWLNTRTVRDEVSYKMFHGDKETYWIAMELTGVEYYFHPRYAGSIGHMTADQELCSTHMLHMDHSGTIPFWINGGIYERKDMPDQGMANMTHYWAGNLDTALASWWWQEGNFACVNERDVHPVPEKTAQTLSKMFQAAADIDMAIQEHFYLPGQIQQQNVTHNGTMLTIHDREPDLLASSEATEQ